jgi:hypothetical protein
MQEVRERSINVQTKKTRAGSGATCQLMLRMVSFGEPLAGTRFGT